MTTNLKRLAARRVLIWLALLGGVGGIENEQVWPLPNGGVRIARTFRSPSVARRYLFFEAITCRNSYGRRALNWLLRAAETPLPASRE